MDTGTEAWTAIDAMIDTKLSLTDPALEAALRASDAGGLPQIQVSPTQGKLLHLMARMRGARSILEIGTLGGYSTIWLARALPPDGKLVTLELVPKHAEVARANIARGGAGLADRVEFLVGPAIESLERLVAERHPPFDLIFIDADKPPIPEYFAWSMRLSKAGTVIIVDNVIARIASAPESSEDAAALGLRRLFDQLASEPRISATVIQTVGVKGHDGMAIAIVE